MVFVVVYDDEQICTFFRSEAGDLFHKLEVKEISRESVSGEGFKCLSDKI